MDSERPRLRKISKRIDDLIGESAALAESSLTELTSFTEATSQAIDFGIQVHNLMSFWCH